MVQGIQVGGLWRQIWVAWEIKEIGWGGHGACYWTIRTSPSSWGSVEASECVCVLGGGWRVQQYFKWLQLHVQKHWRWRWERLHRRCWCEKTSVCAQSLSSTLCDPMDCSSPDDSVHGIFQARILEGLPFALWDLLNPGIKPVFLTSPALAGGFFTTEPPGKPPRRQVIMIKSNLEYQFPFISLNAGHCAEFFCVYIIIPSPHNRSESRSIIHFKDGPGFVFLARALDDCDNTLKLEGACPTTLPPVLTVGAFLTHTFPSHRFLTQVRCLFLGLDSGPWLVRHVAQRLSHSRVWPKGQQHSQSWGTFKIRCSGPTLLN